MAQQLIELVVVPGEGRLPGTALPEGKEVPFPALLPEAVGVYQDALLSLLCAAHRHQVPPAQTAEFPDGHPAILPHRHAVHAAL